MASSGSLGPWLARERLETELSAALGRPVRVERVAVELWRARVLLDGIAVAAGPGWEDGTLLQAPRLVIGVRLASLWRRELSWAPCSSSPPCGSSPATKPLRSSCRSACPTGSRWAR